MRWFHWSTVTDSGFIGSTCHTDSGKNFQTMMSEPKKKKKGSTRKVSDYKESVIISKRHFHTLLDRKQSAAPPENETFRKNRKMCEEKENIGSCTVWKSWTGQKRIVDDDDAIDRGRKLVSSVGATEKAAHRTSPITSLLQLLPMENEWSLHHFVTWLSGISHHITWHPMTFELTIDGVHKKE